LGKPVVFDMDMSAGDFLALFYLLKVPVQVIDLKVFLFFFPNCFFQLCLVLNKIKYWHSKLKKGSQFQKTTDKLSSIRKCMFAWVKGLKNHGKPPWFCEATKSSFCQNHSDSRWFCLFQCSPKHARNYILYYPST